MNLKKLLFGFLTFAFLFLLFINSSQKVLAQQSGAAAAAASACNVTIIKGDTPNTNGQYNLKVKNTCNHQNTYQLSVSLPDGSNTNWSKEITGSKVNHDIITVDANSRSAFHIRITPGSDATVGPHNLTVSAVQTNNAGKHDNHTITYTVAATCGILADPNITASVATQTASVGTPLTYAITLKNQNNAQCPAANYDFTKIKPSSDWTVTVSPNSLKLNSGQELPASVTVTSPSNAIGSNIIRIRATDSTKPNKNFTLPLTYIIGSDPLDCVAHPNICQTGEVCNTTTRRCETTGPGNATTLSFVIGLDTIGTTGTNTTNTFVASDVPPAHPTRDLTIDLYNSTDTSAAPTEIKTSMTYDNVKTSPTYTKFLAQNVGFADSFATGYYLIKVTSPGHLTREIPGLIHIVQGQNTAIPQVRLVAGDIDNNNKIDIFDYTDFISCSSFSKTPEARQVCNQNPPYLLNSDLNDDGVNPSTQNVDQLDYIYLLQEFQVQNGD